MPGSTAKFAFPYPLGTDPISDGDDQIKALAEKVEAILGPASTNVAYNPNAVDVFEGSKVYKSGGIVVVRVAVKLNAAFTAGSPWGNVPVGFRPPAGVAASRAVCWDQTAGPWAVGSFVPLTCDVNGQLYFEAAVATGHNLLGTLVYPLA